MENLVSYISFLFAISLISTHLPTPKNWNIYHWRARVYSVVASFYFIAWLIYTLTIKFSLTVTIVLFIGFISLIIASKWSKNLYDKEI